jgi:hypothetical protein
MEWLELLMNYGENGAGRVARLELGGKWMCKKIGLCAFFILFQGVIKN